MKNNPYKNAKITVKILDITIVCGIIALAVLIGLSF